MAAKIKPAWVWGGGAVALFLALLAGLGDGAGTAPFLLVAAMIFAGGWWVYWPEMNRRKQAARDAGRAGRAAVDAASTAPGFGPASDSPSGLSWFKTSKADGARWQGHSSIFNFGQSSRIRFVVLCVWLAIISGGAALAMFTVPSPIPVLGWLFGAIFVLAVWASIKFWKVPQFISERWVLTAEGGSLRYVSEGGLDYSAAWSLALSEVATVEAARTVEWQGVRDRMKVPGLTGEEGGEPGSALRAVPDAEYQTFIMARDGRRLVVHTGNAEREATSALALSLRSWIEAQRSGLSVRPPVGAPPPVSGPIAAATAPASVPASTSADDEGFSL